MEAWIVFEDILPRLRVDIGIGMEASNEFHFETFCLCACASGDFKSRSTVMIKAVASYYIDLCMNVFVSARRCAYMCVYVFMYV